MKNAQYKITLTPLHDKEEKCHITPKGIAMLAMRECGLIYDIEDKKFEQFWKKFSADMERHGYVKEADE